VWAYAPDLTLIPRRWRAARTRRSSEGLSRSKVDGFVPRTQHVNLTIVGKEGGDGRQRCACRVFFSHKFHQTPNPKGGVRRGPGVHRHCLPTPGPSNAIPGSFLEPLGRSWSHFVGMYRQTLTSFHDTAQVACGADPAFVGGAVGKMGGGALQQL